MKRLILLVMALVMMSGAITAAADAINPVYSVQYYADLPRYATSGGTALSVIDTSGKNLPKNGTTPKTTSLRVNNSGVVMTKNTSMRIYKDRTGLEFIKYPGLRYIDQVTQNNANYELDQIWLSKDNGSSWHEKITYTGMDYSFTNDAASEDIPNGVIAVSDNTVIRLVYKPNASTYTRDAKFFDYDITDGSKSPVDSNLEGINSNSNWKGSGVKFGFGNANTNSGLGDLTWSKDSVNNLLNAGNSKGYKLCTFGLVSSLDANGLPVFANGIRYKDYFGPSKVTGKTEIKGWNLKFNRVGDTYTLAYVNDGSRNITGDLTRFSHPGTYTSIWTNHFWPMDHSSTWGTSGHDIKWGSYDLRNSRLYKKADGTTDALPWADDGLDHNSYFGMTYTVDFTLSGDYAGPLDYTFFGDDDMWVFLEDKKTGKSTLVCDIGGVHSSVGQYVNLRDYLPDGTSGEYRLHFFYTERGASGSTCYMQFTLPSVNTVVPEAKYSNLKIEKIVEGMKTDEPFEFEVMLNERARASTNFAYTIYNKDNTAVSSGIINGIAKLALKDGQYALIPNLFVGTLYEIKESDTNPYYSPSAPSYSGRIGEAGQTVTVTYTNTARGLIDFDIRKVDEFERVGIDGAEFTLTHDENCGCKYDHAKINTITAVSHNGSAKLSGILAGHSYILKETKVPQGYDASKAYEGLMEVSENGAVTIDGKTVESAEIENTPLYWPGSFTVPVKKNVDADAVFAKADMQKFVFELYVCDANGNVVGSVLTSKSPDANGSVVFSGVEEFTFDEYADTQETRYFLIKEKAGSNLYIDYDTEHEYLITATASAAENQTDGAFQLIASTTIKVRENGGTWQDYGADTPVFTNTDKVSGLTFVKKNADTGAVLGGAVFMLTHASDCEACGSGAQALTFSATSAQDGVVTFTNIPAGHDYELEETKAPIGYQISFAKRRVHVTNDGVTNFEDIAAAGIANTPVYQPDAITVPVQKIVAEEDVFAKADMQNFVFELYACDENGNAVGEALASMNPDANGDLVFEGIDEFVFDDYADKDAVRYFLVKEKAGLNPYIDYDTEHEYLITATAELSEQPVEAAGAFVLTASTTIKVRENGGAWQDYAADTAAFTNTDKVSGLVFVKKNADTGAVLGGAVFTLTHADNCEACGGRAKINVFTATSDQDGKVSFGDIPAGHDYMLEETKAPVGYEISFSKRLVQIDENGPKNFEDIASSGIADQPIYQPAQITIPVKKIVGETDVYAKADMQKFVFELYACDETGAVAGEALASENPDAEGNVLFEGLDEFLFDDYADSQETRYFLIKEKHGGSPFIQYDDERAYLVTASAALSETPDEEIGAFVITAETTVRIRETEKGVWEAFGGEAPVFVNSDLGRSGFEFTKLSSFNDRGLNGAEFTLTHSGKCECGYTHVEIPAIVVESVDGKVVFGDQVETEILTGHSYTLKETKAPNGFELMNGTTYTVAIDAQGDVTITRNETSGGKPIEGDLFVARRLFQNTPKYEVKTQIEARKLYNNEIPPKSGERYTFALFDQEITENKFGYLNTESTMKEVKATPGFIETVQNDEQGRILFTPMTFDRAGTYTYWMLEIPGYEADVSYDRTIFKVTITVDEKVNEDGSGTPVIEYAYEIVGQDKLEEGRETFVDGLPTFNNYILPNTGDESSLLLWMLVLAGAGSVIAVMLLMRRRKAN